MHGPPPELLVSSIPAVASAPRRSRDFSYGGGDFCRAAVRGLLSPSPAGTRLVSGLSLLSAIVGGSVSGRTALAWKGILRSRNLGVGSSLVLVSQCVLRAGLGAAAAGLLPLPSGAATGAEPGSIAPSNGSTDPFPIPWLDKNGDRNQPAKPDQEPSHIYDFKGRVARCSTFTGMGTDNQGNRIVFGSPTTDYGFTQDEYFAGRSPQAGTFSPI